MACGFFSFTTFPGCSYIAGTKQERFMTIDEIKAFLVANKDKDDVKAFLTEIASPSAEAVQKAAQDYLSSDIGKRLIQSEADKMSNKSIETFKKTFEEKELPKLVADRYNKEHPAETDADKAIRAMQEKLDALEREKLSESLKSKAMRAAADRKLPVELLDVLHFGSEDEVSAKIEKAHEILNTAVIAAVNERLKAAGTNPAQSGNAAPGNGKITTREQLQKLSPDEIVQARDEGRIEIPGVNLSAFKQ